MRVERGFSLVELVITVALAALVLALGVPSFQSLSHKNHAEAHQEEFLSAVRLARQVALEHGRKSEICPRDATLAATAIANCDKTTTGAWKNGWVIMLDGAAIMSNRHESDGASFTITNSSGIATTSIQFSPTGTLWGTSAPCVHFKIDAEGEIKQAKINLAGHIQFDESSCS